MRTVLIICCLFYSLGAKNIEKGFLFPYPTFNSQFNKSVKITEQTKEIIISFTKESGKSVKDFLEKNKGYLSKNNTVYLVDASQVPTIAKFLFFMPSLKKLDFDVGLIEDRRKAKKLPRQKGKVTRIKLKNKIIMSIDFLDRL